ncbi:MAG: glycerol-3-phosphate 1-O-acyltransferase PlsY [Planctomycetota bacterium]
MPYALWLAIAYLAGSIPFALLLGFTRGVDIRKEGSGNVGATNLGRTCGKPLGLTCFALDVLKGFAPVIAFGLIANPGNSASDAGLWMALGAAAVLGHVFPVWLKFKGGKGVATSLGVLLGFWPVLTGPALAALLIWFVVTKTTGYVGLASVVAAATLPPLAVISGLLLQLTLPALAVYAGICVALAALVIVRHRSNLARIRQGTEDKARWAKKGD